MAQLLMSNRRCLFAGRQFIINSMSSSKNNNFNFLAAVADVGFQSRIFSSSSEGGGGGGGVSNAERSSGGGFSFKSNAQQFLKSTPSLKCYIGHCQFDFPRYVREKHTFSVCKSKEYMWRAAEYAVLEHNEEEDDDLELVRVLDYKRHGAGPAPVTMILEAKHKNLIEQEEPPPPPLLFCAVISMRIWTNVIKLLAWKPLQSR